VKLLKIKLVLDQFLVSQCETAQDKTGFGSVLNNPMWSCSRQNWFWISS